ncbi:NUDIX domain-containing protein [Allocatelliglobosispora scoriae]|nr:NUDIX hydrolase [Allocatelliglobosispora scoriae]
MFHIVTDEVEMSDGAVLARDYMVHVGAVGVVALDDEDRVVLVRQYRHPVRQFLWELPAGLIDVAGEGLAEAALRELTEEADLIAESVIHLIDIHPTPGCSNERIRLFLARSLTEVPVEEQHERHGEEIDIEVRRVPLAQAVQMIFRGEITNGAAVAGILAAANLVRLEE